MELSFAGKRHFPLKLKMGAIERNTNTEKAIRIRPNQQLCTSYPLYRNHNIPFIASLIKMGQCCYSFLFPDSSGDEESRPLLSKTQQPAVTSTLDDRPSNKSYETITAEAHR